MTTPEQAYTIGTLVWEGAGNNCFTARTVLGSLYVAYKWKMGGLWWFTRTEESFDTSHEARKAAEAWYRERILPALTEVTTKATT